jgi:hypothetical protein
MSMEDVGEIAAVAAAAANGTPNEMRLAAGDAMAECVKALGGRDGGYRWQVKARSDAGAVVDKVLGLAGGDLKSEVPAEQGDPKPDVASKHPLAPDS